MTARVCYLAGPVDFAPDQGVGWRDKVKAYVKSNKLNMSFYDPPAAFSVPVPGDDIAAFLFNVNMEALRTSGIVLAKWAKKDTSVGTPIEIYEAWKIGIPTLMITDMQSSLTIRYFSMSHPTKFETLPLDADEDTIMSKLLFMAGELPIGVSNV